MRLKLAPFPGTRKENSFLSTAWSKSEVNETGANEGVLLVCGSEGGKVFIWRIKKGQTASGRTVATLSLTEETVSGPIVASWQVASLTVGSDEEDVAAICFFNEQKSKCFVSCGQKIALIDLTATSTSDASPTVEGEWTFNEDDVNCLALNPDDSFLAAADDSGEIKLIQLKPQIKVHRTLRKHTTICSSVIFRPRRSSSILSSGLDSTIVVWEDFSKCRVGQVVKMPDVMKVAAAKKKEEEGVSELDPPRAYMINPPLVHCVATSPSGNLLAAGVEDSTIQLFDTSKKTVIWVTSTPSRVHSKGVSQIVFLSETTFISGGNDGIIAVWKVSQSTAAVTTAKPEAGQNDGNKGRRQKSGKNKTAAQKSQPETKLTVQTVIQPLAQIQHEEAINWLSVLRIAAEEGATENAVEDVIENLTLDNQSQSLPSDSVAKKLNRIIVAVADSSCDMVVYEIGI